MVTAVRIFFFTTALILVFLTSWIVLPAPKQTLLELAVGAPEVSAWLAVAGLLLCVMTLRLGGGDALGSAAFFVVAPGTFVGLGPWLITHWEIPGSSPPLRVILGVVLIVLGLIPPVHAFIQFVKAGGTPMPVAPTERLVVTGFNRFVRNPMYIGLLTAILGQALLFDSLWLVLYAVIGWIVTASFVHWYEEPTLVRTYGEQYEEYRRNVPAWTPRLTPWTPSETD